MINSVTVCVTACTHRWASASEASCHYGGGKWPAFIYTASLKGSALRALSCAALLEGSVGGRYTTRWKGQISAHGSSAGDTGEWFMNQGRLTKLSCPRFGKSKSGCDSLSVGTIKRLLLWKLCFHLIWLTSIELVRESQRRWTFGQISNCWPLIINRSTHTHSHESSSLFYNIQSSLEMFYDTSIGKCPN